jgi:hypothetical protein
MRNLVFASSALLLVLALAPATAGAQPAPAQKAEPPQAAPPATASKAYKPVAVKLPPFLSDASLDAFRKEVAAVAQRRDRAALARMVVAKGFFWDRDDGKGADDSKSGIDNLAAAFELDASDGAGWDALGKAVGEPHAAPDPQNKGVVCAPTAPELNDKNFEALILATQSDPSDWGFAAAPGVEVRSAPKPDAPVVEKLGPVLVRISVDESPLAAVQGISSEWLRVVTPSGKQGYVLGTAMIALVADEMCYLKDASGWKIAGIVSGGVGGGGDQQ